MAFLHVSSNIFKHTCSKLCLQYWYALDMHVRSHIMALLHTSPLCFTWLDSTCTGLKWNSSLCVQHIVISGLLWLKHVILFRICVIYTDVQWYHCDHCNHTSKTLMFLCTSLPPQCSNLHNCGKMISKFYIVSSQLLDFKCSRAYGILQQQYS